MSYDVRPGGVQSDTTGAAARRAAEAVTAPIGKAGQDSPLGPTVHSSGVNRLFKNVGALPLRAY